MMHFHTLEPGNYRDNEVVFQIGIQLAKDGKRNDAIRVQEMLKRHIEGTNKHLSVNEDPSKRFILPLIEAELASLRRESIVDLANERRDGNEWRFSAAPLPRAVAVAVYYATILGLLVVSTSAGEMTITLPI